VPVIPFNGIHLTSFLTPPSGNTLDALKVSLSSPPYGLDPSLESSKALATRSVMDVITATKSTDIAKTIQQLTLEEQDVLIKYIYRGFKYPELSNCGLLLTWHDKLVEAAGIGAVVRVLTDRRTL